MVRKLSVFIGVLLLSFLVFSSVAHSSDALTLAVADRYSVSGSIVYGEVKETVYDRGYGGRSGPDGLIYSPGPENVIMFPANRPVRQYIYSTDYLSQRPADLYLEGYVARTLDERIFTLLDDLSAAGMVILFIFLRYMYTNKMGCQSKNSSEGTRLPF